MDFRERLGYLAGTLVFGGVMLGAILLVAALATTAPFLAIFFPLTLTAVAVFFLLGYLRHRRRGRK